jgi:curved DNA-binding protein CbpA
VLGLSRSAGAPEVERAFRALSEEFHPLRYVGHPDARWRVRAEALQGVLKEAALALADDRLRAEYARNLTE